MSVDFLLEIILKLHGDDVTVMNLEIIFGSHARSQQPKRLSVRPVSRHRWTMQGLQGGAYVCVPIPPRPIPRIFQEVWQCGVEQPRYELQIL
jgi:hypothetical protein